MYTGLASGVGGGVASHGDLHNELEGRVVLEGRVGRKPPGCDASDPLGRNTVDAGCNGENGG